VVAPSLEVELLLLRDVVELWEDDDDDKLELEEVELVDVVVVVVPSGLFLLATISP
jgi:hypothetical protein